jgi:hypothetical protein
VLLLRKYKQSTKQSRILVNWAATQHPEAEAAELMQKLCSPALVWLGLLMV